MYDYIVESILLYMIFCDSGHTKADERADMECFLSLIILDSAIKFMLGFFLIVLIWNFYTIQLPESRSLKNTALEQPWLQDLNF